MCQPHRREPLHLPGFKNSRRGRAMFGHDVRRNACTVGLLKRTRPGTLKLIRQNRGSSTLNPYPVSTTATECYYPAPMKARAHWQIHRTRKEKINAAGVKPTSSSQLFCCTIRSHVANYRMKMTPLVSILAIGATSAVALAFSATISPAIDQSPSIEELLKTGWQIAE